MSRKTGGKKKLLMLLVLLIIVAVAVVCVVYFWPKKPAQAGYQAVFVSNGQVYFGKITKETRQYAELSEIYYLQLQKPLQTQEPPVEGAAAAQSKLTLIKLGNELHGPVDTMKINRDHILFIEDLKSDGKVVQAIEEYKKSQVGK